MRIHKRLIDLNSSADVVKQIVSTSSHLTGSILISQKTSISLEPGVEVEVTIAAVSN